MPMFPTGHLFFPTNTLGGIEGTSMWWGTLAPTPLGSAGYLSEAEAMGGEEAEDTRSRRNRQLKRRAYIILLLQEKFNFQIFRHPTRVYSLYDINPPYS